MTVYPLSSVPDQTWHISSDGSPPFHLNEGGSLHFHIQHLRQLSLGVSSKGRRVLVSVSVLEKLLRPTKVS